MAGQSDLRKLLPDLLPLASRSPPVGGVCTPSTPDGLSSPPLPRGREGTDRQPLTARLNIDPNKAIYVTLHSKTATRLSTVNSFIIKKVIDCNIGNVVNVEKLARGDLLV